MKMRLMEEGSVGDGLVFSRKDTECIYKYVAARARADWSIRALDRMALQRVVVRGNWTHNCYISHQQVFL